MSLQSLIDRTEIHDVLLRYARGVDRRDWDLVRSAYHDDATDLHGDFEGTADAVVAYIKSRHLDGGQAMHFLGNSLIEFIDRRNALVETYFSSRRIGPYEAGAMSRLAEGSDICDLDVVGRYVDHFSKRNGEWRIARRVVVYEAVRLVPARVAKTSPNWVWSRRDSTDALNRMRTDLLKATRIDE